jgi:hypothetical protein
VRRRRPCCASMSGHLCRAVAPTGTNDLICTGGKNTRYK